MAENLCEEEKPYFLAIADGSCNLPIGSCLQLLNPSFDEVNQHCSLDVLPILFDEASFSMRQKCPFRSSNGQDVYSLPEFPNEINNSPQCTSQLALLGFLEVPIPSKSKMYLEAPLNCQNCVDLQMASPDAYSPCIVGMDVDKEYTEAPNSCVKASGSMKSEGVRTGGALQRQASLKLGGKLIENLMNYGLTLLKFNSREKSLTERVHEAPNNRWRRYRRAASFDSRQIVIFFSILSSLGTLVLIYLTLRVKQSVEGHS